jgi:uncharacterized DUF497 family protein
MGGIMHTVYYKKIETKDGVYRFSIEKNALLFETRGVRFEDIVRVIDEGHVIEVIDNYNQQKYPNEKMYIVRLSDYIYMVPFVVGKDGDIFLKTIIPSRKVKKQYLTRGEIYET